MINEATFRQNFPEFGSVSAYPANAIQLYIGLGVLMLNTRRWGTGSATAQVPSTTLYDYGLALFVAHNLVLEQQAAKKAAAGGLPGLNTGAISSEAVGSVSRSYDAASGLEENAGHWNLTTYGTRFINMSRMFGVGPLQVSGCGWGGFGAAGGWPGPIPFPLPGGCGFSS